MTSLFSPIVENALRLSLFWHQEAKHHHERDEEIVHSVSVAMILARAGFGETVVAAGICHDLLMDTECPPQEILDICSRSVLEMVQHLTLDPRFDADQQWREQHESFLYSLAHTSTDVMAICAADHIHTIELMLSALEEYGLPYFEHLGIKPEDWLWFEDQICITLQETWDHPLLIELDSYLDEVVELMEVLDEEEKQGVYRNHLPPLEESWDAEASEVLDSEVYYESVGEPETKSASQKRSRLKSPRSQLHPKATLSIGLGKSFVEIKYLSHDEALLLLPAALQLALKEKQLSNRMIQENLSLNYLSAHRLLKELKRLHIIQRVDSVHPRNIAESKAKELLTILKAEI